jgi:predicted RNase H-like nuclease (RuvC/YqgF family)
MTRSQATAMNNKFIKLKNERDSMKADYEGMVSISDSLGTHIVRIEYRLQEAANTMTLLKKRAAQLKKQQANELFARTLFLGWVSFVLTIAEF